MMEGRDVNRIIIYLFKNLLCVAALVLISIIPSQAQNSHDLDLSSNIKGEGLAQARKQKEKEKSKTVIVPPNKYPVVSGKETTSGSETVNVNKLDVTTTNEVSGGIEAKEGGQVSVGDAKLTKVNADAITINTKNTIAGKIEASDDGTFKAGTVNLENHQGQSVKISSDNTLNGKVTTKQKSIISIGNTNSGGVPDQTGGVGNSGAGIGSSQPIIPTNPPGTTTPIIGPGSHTDPNNSDTCMTQEKCSVDCARDKHCHIVDGCSYPGWLGFEFLLGFLFGHEESCCADEIQPPLACNTHDRCYQTCHPGIDPLVAKAACDMGIYEDALSTCIRLSPIVRTVSPNVYFECVAEAEKLFLGVTLFKEAQDAWNERQVQFCNGTGAGNGGGGGGM